MALILVVDDEFGIAEVLEALFVDFGHQVQIAANGRLGLERVQMMRPDVILLDMMMPVMDGPTMLRTLRADPAHAAIPVLVMSSLSQVAVDGAVAGLYQTFLRKPFRAQEVLDAVARLLQQAPADRAD